MAFLVHKYGGSSVGTPEKIKQIAQSIARVRAQGHRLVVIVSAMGDTTDELIDLSRKVTDHTYEREMDMLLSCGERISMALMSMALKDQGIDAISFTGSQSGIITTESHTRARILEIRPTRVIEELGKNKVVIIAGFQGVSRSKEITTLGRGGSDTSAVAMAAAIAQAFPDEEVRCEVFTDVNGIYSADPRIVPNAKRYQEISFDLVYEMALCGAQVMHARSIEIAREKNIPLKVAHSVTGEGTMIVNEPKLELPKVIAVTAKKNLSRFAFSAAEANTVLSACAESNQSVQDCRLGSDGGLELVIDPSQAGSFHEIYSKNIKQNGLCFVSCVGFHLGQNTDLISKGLRALSQGGISVQSLTTSAQSFTFWVQDSCAEQATSILHNAMIGST